VLKLVQHGQYWGLTSRRCRDTVRRLGPRIIHAHFGYDAVLVYDIARMLNVPLVVTLHGSDITRDRAHWRSGSEGYFFRRYPDKLTAMFADSNVHFIAISQAVRATAIERGAPPERTHLFYTGVNCAFFAPAGRPVPERQNVLFVGRLVEIKGCE